jgi:hypothetical protein
MVESGRHIGNSEEGEHPPLEAVTRGQWLTEAVSPGTKRHIYETGHSSPSNATVRIVELYLRSPIRLQDAVPKWLQIRIIFLTFYHI